MIVQEKIALDFAELTMVKDGVICVDFLSEDALNVEKGIQMVGAIQKLSNNEPCIVIYNVGDKYIFTTEALRFMGSQLNTNEHRYLARAIVSTNPATRIAGNNFIKLYKPLVATKLFSELEAALVWANEIGAS